MALRDENYLFTRRIADRGSDKIEFDSQDRKIQETDPKDVIWDEINGKEEHPGDSGGYKFQETDSAAFIRDENDGKEEYPGGCSNIYPSPPCFDIYGDEEVSNEDCRWVMKALNGVTNQEGEPLQGFGFFYRSNQGSTVAQGEPLTVLGFPEVCLKNHFSVMIGALGLTNEPLISEVHGISYSEPSILEFQRRNNVENDDTIAAIRDDDVRINFCECMQVKDIPCGLTYVINSYEEYGAFHMVTEGHCKPPKHTRGISQAMANASVKSRASMNYLLLAGGESRKENTCRDDCIPKVNLENKTMIQVSVKKESDSSMIIRKVEWRMQVMILVNRIHGDVPYDPGGVKITENSRTSFFEDGEYDAGAFQSKDNLNL